jgi:hypothetical protein
MGKAKVPKEMKLYVGTFNRSGEVIIIKSKAVSERKAWVNMCKQIAERDQVFVSHVMAKFDGDKANFTIEEYKT